MEHYVKEARDGVRIQMPLYDRQIVSELSSDFSLPDYKPEIKRLLRIRTTVSPADKYIGAGSAEFSGTVDYNILYCGNDGALYCVTQTEEYRFTAPVETPSDFDPADGLICDVESLADGATGRVVAPRKLSIKCRLRSRVRLYGSRMPEESLRQSGGGEAALERLHQSAECAQVCVGDSEPLSLGDEILCDSTMGDLRVISAEGQVFVTEAVAGSDVVNCRGEVCLKLLCVQEEEGSLPSVQLRRIPFSQTVPVEGVAVNFECCAAGVCSDLNVTVEESRILCDVVVKLHVRGQKNRAVTLIRDLYSTEAESRTEQASYILPVALKCGNGNFSLNSTLSLEEAGIRAGAQILDIGGVPTVTGMEQDRNRVYLTGKCRYQAVLAGESDVGVQEFEVSFRYEIEGVGGIPAAYDATVDLISCRARMDGERIAVDGELAVSVAIRGERGVTVVSQVSLGEPAQRSGAVYTVCYPAREDTLWSVAKRYLRPVEQLAEMNGLSGAAAADSPESLAGVSYLLV
ncbi:MAG: LysM peptidoglycan-binding domain-containing protein [Clostridia bacterium]|nr:LysM peptidoglycan-binding domain-containing protein [Clostridia bacterium]